jgi:hypothetical protein
MPLIIELENIWKAIPVEIEQFRLRVESRYLELLVMGPMTTNRRALGFARCGWNVPRLIQRSFSRPSPRKLKAQ